jgi:hypothetical protein
MELAISATSTKDKEDPKRAPDLSDRVEPRLM